MKQHIVNYQLKILLLSVRKPVENSDTARDNDRDDEIEVNSRKIPARKPRE